VKDGCEASMPLERRPQRGKHNRSDLLHSTLVERKQVGDDAERLAEGVGAGSNAADLASRGEALKQIDERWPERSPLARETLETDKSQIEKNELVLAEEIDVNRGENGGQCACESLKARRGKLGQQTSVLEVTEQTETGETLAIEVGGPKEDVATALPPLVGVLGDPEADERLARERVDRRVECADESALLQPVGQVGQLKKRRRQIEVL
jgi:stress response protein YsnF